MSSNASRQTDPLAGLPESAFGWRPFEAEDRAAYARLPLGEKISRLEDMDELMEAIRQSPSAPQSKRKR